MNQENEISKIGKPPPPAGCVEAAFDDFDAFADAVAAWDLEFLQLEPGPLRAELVQLVMPGCNLLRCSLNMSMQQAGGLPPGFRTFGIPMPGCSPFRWHGHPAGDGVVMIFPRGGELESCSLGGFKVITFSMEESRLLELAELENLGWVLDQGALVSRPKANVQHVLQHTAERWIAGAARDHDLLTDPALRRRQEEELASALLNALAGEKLPNPRIMAKERSRVLHSALEVIDGAVGRPISITDLCRLTGSTSRTLRYAFEEKFGIPPKSYLTAKRLAEVKRRLRRAGRSGGSVKEVAIDLGFRNLGQLAKDYRNMFGELPSATLKSAAFPRSLPAGIPESDPPGANSWSA